MSEINIGKIIMQKRREKGTTQDELASFIGVSKASVSKWETCQSYPDIAFLPQLAAYFNISLDELMGYSPQMTADDICKTYKELSMRFTNEDFYTVLADCREIIKKYYSCYPLVLQMALLLFNYAVTITEPTEKSNILREVVDLCSKVRSESGDVDLSKTAIIGEAQCRLLLGEPQEVLNLLGEKAEPRDMGETLIAQAYAATGKTEMAKAIMHSACCYSLSAFFNAAISYIGMCMDDFDKAEKFLKMTLSMVDISDFETLNPNDAVLLYTAGAQLYCVNNRHDDAIRMLWQITDLCTKRFFPFKVGKNEFFDAYTIDELLGDTELLQAEMPRSEKVIKESMLNDIILSPVFAPLSDDDEYKKIVETFKDFVGE